MIAKELRGGSKPSLNEALGWIGSRVDDIYGASVGRLEDVWIDPGTGVPRWLLVKEGRFGGRTTLIPFEDATAGAGHVWVPYERDVVRDAPPIEPGAPLTQQVEASLRSHYSASVPEAFAYGAPERSPRPSPPAPTGPQPGSAMGTATIRFHSPPEAGSPEYFAAREQTQEERAPERHAPGAPPRRHVLREQPPPAVDRQQFTPHLPERPAPPIAAPERRSQQPPQPAGSWAAEPAPPSHYQPVQHHQQQHAQQPQQAQQQQHAQQPPTQYAQQPPTQQQQQPRYESAGAAHFPGHVQPRQEPQPQRPAAPDPAQAPVDALRSLAESGGSHYVEIELSGELSIRGELRSIKVTPRDDGGR